MPRSDAGGGRHGETHLATSAAWSASMSCSCACLAAARSSSSMSVAQAFEQVAVEVSSGNRKVHRLSLRGNRRINHAIHMAAITQIRHRHSDGRAYYDKKLAEGKTHKEALRCLKRQISDAIFTRLQADARKAAARAKWRASNFPDCGSFRILNRKGRVNCQEKPRTIPRSSARKPPAWWWRRRALSRTSPRRSGSARPLSVTG